MISGSISRRYAKALLAIGVETKEFEKIGKELEQFTALMKHKDLSETLENPSYVLSKRKAVLDALVKRTGVSRTMRNFLMLLADRGRTSYIAAISREYQVMADEHAGQIRAEVATATPLDPASVTRLKSALEKKTGKRIILEQKTDAELIAGTVTKIGSMVYDGSIRTRLQQMRQTLLEGEQ